jgi:hypothetical protein
MFYERRVFQKSGTLTKRAQMKWEVKGKEKNDFHFDGGERKAAKLRHRF